MRTFEWPIEDIVNAHPDLYLEHCAAMAVALMSEQSSAPCYFRVECEGFSPPDLNGDDRFTLGVHWDDPYAQRAARILLTEQPKPIVERATVAISALLFAHLVSKGEMRVTNRGDRADFWLPRLQCALEISGTLRRRSLPRRHRQKVAQVLDNPRRWNGYVIVCCFAATQKIIRWSYHNQRG